MSSGDNLPVSTDAQLELSSQLEIPETINIPPELLHDVVAAAQPALDRIKLFELETVPDWIFTSEPPYDEVREPAVRSVEPDRNRVTLTYRQRHLSSSYVGDLSFDTVWGASEEEARNKIEQQKQVEQAKAELVKTHHLGSGALILDNRFGGIDTENIDVSAQALLLRTQIAQQARIELPRDLARAGLLSPVLAELLGRDIMTYMEDVRKLMDSYDLLPVASKEVVGPTLLEAAVDQSKTFVQTHAAKIALAAHVASDPKQATHIAEIVQAQNRS